AIFPLSPFMSTVVGENVTISCSYKGFAGRVLNAQWYRQYPRSKPDFRTYSYSHKGPDLPITISRFSSKFDQDLQQVDLQISKVFLTDSAVYYCFLYKNILYFRFKAFHITVKGIFSSFTESADAYTIESLLPEQRVSVGQSAVISCKYSGIGPSFQWYRQYPGSRPEYLIFNAETAVSSEPTLRLKAQAKKEITEVELEISSTEVKDSAVYYCALVPTVTGNPPLNV
uniref:T-cell receptor alpha/delta variable 8.0 n=1 Tax=Sinocyclocheilus anshuiensis TaxID=1608454 RepID=A0A671Q1Q6_9TELE